MRKLDLGTLWNKVAMASVSGHVSTTTFAKKEEIWESTNLQATLTPLAARVAVEAIPLRELLRGTKGRGTDLTKNGGPLALRKGQHFQQDGVVFTCLLPKLCATALLALGAVTGTGVSLKKTLEDAYGDEAKPIKPAFTAAGVKSAP